MTLGLFVLLLSYVCVAVGYQEDYRGFDNCGSGGWHCREYGTGYDVIFECSSAYEGARLWLWTARIPSSAVKYTIQNCHHVELHMDCTTGYRSYNLRQFQVKNVNHLEILRPLRPQVFLHDNDQIPHAPPEFILTNVDRITWFTGAFDKAEKGRCRTKQQFLQKLDFNNVTLPRLESGLFKNQSLDSFSINNSRIPEINKDSVIVTAKTIEIRNSHINDIPSSSLTFEADEVIVTNNNIGKINEYAFKILAHTVNFTENKVDIISSRGLAAKAHEVNIIRNEFKEVKNFSFSEIEPGEKWFENYRKASKFTFKFINNTVQEMEENSIRPNYHSYKETCYKFIIENNHFQCNCKVPKENYEEKNGTWWNHGFPELFSTSNRCLGPFSNCSLLNFIHKYQTPNCNDTNPVVDCTEEETDFFSIHVLPIGNYPITATEAPVTKRINELIKTSTPTPNLPSGKESVSIEFKHNSTKSAIFVMWTIFGVLIFMIGLGGIAYWANKRRKENVMKAIHSYKHENHVTIIEDQENLIETSADVTTL